MAATVHLSAPQSIMDRLSRKPQCRCSRRQCGDACRARPRGRHRSTGGAAVGRERRRAHRREKSSPHAASTSSAAHLGCRALPRENADVPDEDEEQRERQSLMHQREADRHGMASVAMPTPNCARTSAAARSARRHASPPLRQPRWHSQDRGRNRSAIVRAETGSWRCSRRRSAS